MNILLLSLLVLAIVSILIIVVSQTAVFAQTDVNQTIVETENELLLVEKIRNAKTAEEIGKVAYDNLPEIENMLIPEDKPLNEAQTREMIYFYKSLTNVNEIPFDIVDSKVMALADRIDKEFSEYQKYKLYLVITGLWSDYHYTIDTSDPYDARLVNNWNKALTLLEKFSNITN